MRSCRCVYILRSSYFTLLSFARRKLVTEGILLGLQFAISTIQSFHANAGREEIAKMAWG